MSNLSQTIYVRILAQLLGKTSIIWNDFAHNIRHKNRFFPQSKELHNALRKISQNTIVIKSNTRFYRARNMKMYCPEGFHQKNNKLWGYDQNNMKKPPEAKAMAGRANPQHIPYLYLASNRQTACSEIRAGLHDIVSIMEFRTTKDFCVVDLTMFDWKNKDAFTIFCVGYS